MRSEIRHTLLVIGALIFPVMLGAHPAQTRHKSAAAGSAAPLVQYRNTAPGVAYVGSQACAQCHGDINEKFVKTDMGHTLALPNEWKGLQALTTPIRVSLPKTNRYYEVFYRDS